MLEDPRYRARLGPPDVDRPVEGDPPTSPLRARGLNWPWTGVFSSGVGAGILMVASVVFASYESVLLDEPRPRSVQGDDGPFERGAQRLDTGVGGHPKTPTGRRY
jgi:hypothetical protein